MFILHNILTCIFYLFSKYDNNINKIEYQCLSTEMLQNYSIDNYAFVHLSVKLMTYFTLFTGYHCTVSACSVILVLSRNFLYTCESFFFYSVKSTNGAGKDSNILQHVFYHEAQALLILLHWTTPLGCLINISDLIM